MRQPQIQSCNKRDFEDKITTSFALENFNEEDVEPDSSRRLFELMKLTAHTRIDSRCNSKYDMPTRNVKSNSSCPNKIVVD